MQSNYLRRENISIDLFCISLVYLYFLFAPIMCFFFLYLSYYTFIVVSQCVKLFHCCAFSVGSRPDSKLHCEVFDIKTHCLLLNHLSLKTHYFRLGLKKKIKKKDFTICCVIFHCILSL